jgi:hypothetical protein
VTNAGEMFSPRSKRRWNVLTLINALLALAAIAFFLAAVEVQAPRVNLLGVGLLLVTLAFLVA